MHVEVNGVDLFFDVAGSSLAVEGPAMRSKPTLLLLHGGPGFDHSIYRPRFDDLADVAQVVYLDLRGNGRSDAGPQEDWNLAQWGDDVAAFCDALRIERPIVYGASWGGTVAMSYATRHPDHPAGLVLVSTEATAYTRLEERVERFRALGGPEAGELAHRRFIGGDTGPEMLEAWVRLALPVYTHRSIPVDVIARGIRRPEVTAWFTRPGGEGQTFDLMADLARISCPALVVGGEDDPMVPIECQEDIADALPAGVGRFERVSGAGHGVVADAPDVLMGLVREFLSTTGAATR